MATKQIQYGALYNWYAVTDARGVAPAGWHVPTQDELNALATYVGGKSVAGGKLREIGTEHWSYPNTGATDEFGFNARGSGYRNDSGDFQFLMNNFSVHTNTEYIPYPDLGWDTIYGCSIYSFDTSFGGWVGVPRTYGFAIRLIKDDSTNPGTVTDYDGNVYQTVKIGDQVWTKQNLIVTHYNNGDLIPLDPDGVTGYYTDAEWATLTTGAMCYYDNDINNAWIMISGRRIFIT
jgi:uncharacterized protein (TIGR02145 family)